MDVIKELFAMQDKAYKDFNSKLIPTVPKENIIGIRTPVLRKFARSFSDSLEANVFLSDLPHFYFEENNLHGFLIERIKDFDKCIWELERFLPYVDNWATCDSMNPKVLGTNKERLLTIIKKWIKTTDVYTVRFGIKCLMSYFLDKDFKEEYLSLAIIESDEYYINMMCAWFFATALAKQYESAVKYIEENKLPLWTHNKAIQKAIESYRITPEQKTYLKSLKRKEKEKCSE